jgi:phosphotransferase system HPr-like phosphotransfer protein
MSSLTIQLRTIADVKEFVRIVNGYEFDIDLSSGRYVVDAKSIMGIFSLDLGKPLRVDVRETSCGALLEDLKPFVL